MIPNIVSRTSMTRLFTEPEPGVGGNTSQGSTARSAGWVKLATVVSHQLEESGRAHPMSTRIGPAQATDITGESLRFDVPQGWY